MNIELMIDSVPALLEGLVVTFQLVAAALVVGFVIAVPTALARISRFAALRWISLGYVFFFRGTPLLVQIFLIYYGFSQFEAVRESIFWPVLREAYWCALIAFSLNTGAYSAEVFRGGILSVPHGEVEAARAIGMSPATVFWRIVWPQALRQALPAYGNEIILLVKASSLASTVTLMDLTGVARSLAADTYMPIEIFATSALIYLAVTYLLSRLIVLLEVWLAPVEGRV